MLKAPEIRTTGEKYLGELGGYKAEKKKASRSSGASTDANAAESKRVSTPMDHLYGQAIALELLPHVLMCFDSIYNTNVPRMQAKMKSLKAREVRRNAASTANANANANASTNSNVRDSSSTGGSASASASGQQLMCMVGNLWDAKDLLDAEVVNRLEGPWDLLVQGGLLDAAALNKDHSSIPSSSISSNVHSNHTSAQPALINTSTSIAATAVMPQPAASAADEFDPDFDE